MRWLLVVVLVLCAESSSADSKSARLQISARLVPVVTVSTTNLDFGTWRKCDNERRATATVTVHAQRGLPFAITMDAGQYSSCGSQRNVQNSGFRVPYAIYAPNGCSLWGDKGYANTFQAGSPVHGTGTGKAQAFAAHGVLQTKSVTHSYPGGLYTDSVTVTVYY
jgi:spore coat protein U-like protein